MIPVYSTKCQCQLDGHEKYWMFIFAFSVHDKTFKIFWLFLSYLKTFEIEIFIL